MDTKDLREAKLKFTDPRSIPPLFPDFGLTKSMPFVQALYFPEEIQRRIARWIEVAIVDVQPEDLRREAISLLWGRGPHERIESEAVLYDVELDKLPEEAAPEPPAQENEVVIGWERIRRFLAKIGYPRSRKQLFRWKITAAKNPKTYGYPFLDNDPRATAGRVVALKGKLAAWPARMGARSEDTPKSR